MSNPRMLPRLDSLNRPFWTGGENGELKIVQCKDCEGFVHPPQPICRHCLSENVEPTVVSGEATVDTYTINHQPWIPGMEVPFVIARVALNDAPGVILMTNIVDCDVNDVNIGDPVRVKFLQQEDVWIPQFEKV